MKQMTDHFDNSGYGEANAYGMPRVNKKILGKVKDKLDGGVMRVMVGLKSKIADVGARELR